MLEDAWNSILEFTSKFVIPDWESVIAMIPIALLIVIIIWVILTIRRFATAGPTRRGRARVTPAPPAGIHMPGGSWAPILAALGTFLTFWGLVVGGPALWFGIAAFVLTLLFWGREGLRDYDVLGRHGAAETALVPAVEHAGPPAGVHMPGPSFRPILGALGVAVLFFGLVFGGWLLLVGIILTIVTLLGWLVDARREYAHTVEADSTGHLRPLPDPRWPRRLLWVGGLLIALALLADAGIFPPREPEEATAGGPGPAPTGQPPGSGAPPASEAPGGPGPSLPEADVAITAQAIQFTTQQVEVTGPDFTIAFDNRDQGVPHDVDIRDEGDTKVFDGDIINGPDIVVYEVTGIQPASYEFFCSVHPNMTGTITVN